VFAKLSERPECFVGQSKARGFVKCQRIYLLRQLRIRFGNQVDDDTLLRLAKQMPSSSSAGRIVC
jgi:hypothetical protein